MVRNLLVATNKKPQLNWLEQKRKGGSDWPLALKALQSPSQLAMTFGPAVRILGLWFCSPVLLPILPPSVY